MKDTSSTENSPVIPAEDRTLSSQGGYIEPDILPSGEVGTNVFN